MDYGVVTPARDEAENLAALAATVTSQTLLPAAWVIVDDGSTDGTAEVADELARRHHWIHVLRTARAAAGLPDGRREGRALLSFQDGIAALPAAVELVAKLDADVTLPPDYFGRIAAAFAEDARLGMASGRRCEPDRGGWRERHLTGTAVEAQCRTYRWDCWRDVQPLEPRMGWDGVDEARAVLRGWRTRVIDELWFRHHRTMGHRDGRRARARAAEGVAAHYMGYRPSYVLLRALWHARREPTALAMVWGWASAVVQRRSRCPDADVRAYVRRQQAARRLAQRLREARGLS
jgi:glycosyltransferase involved in cell wall biosynthesis